MKIENFSHINFDLFYPNILIFKVTNFYLITTGACNILHMTSICLHVLVT